jgi:hypothetical protein
MSLLCVNLTTPVVVAVRAHTAALLQQLPRVVANQPHHIVAYIWLPPTSKCARSSDNSHCPFMTILADDQVRNLLVCGADALLPPPPPRAHE